MPYEGVGCSRAAFILQAGAAVAVESPEHSRSSLGGGPGMANLPRLPRCILTLPRAPRLRDTYHIPHRSELRGGEIPGAMWERAGLGMQLGPRTTLLAHFLL